MKRLTVLLLSLIITPHATIATDQSIEATISKTAAAMLEKPEVTGITLAAGKNGEMLFAAGYGIADIETGAAVETSTKMRTGSVSKVYTTALIGKLLEAGKLDLDAPVQTYVPGFPKKHWPITLRQMTGHMSGIRHYRGNEFSSTKHYPTVAAGLVIFANDPLRFEPGTRSAYSSYAWNLVSAALEGTGNTPFLDMMQEQVFAPLGMADTVAEDVTKKITNVAAFHQTNGDTASIAPFVDNSYKWAGGGFIGTATDMVKFGLAHTKPGYLKAETLALLSKEQQTASGEKIGFGIGWMTSAAMDNRLERTGQPELQSAYGDKLIWHSGGSMGAVALLLVDPAEKSSVALMANNSGSFPAILTLGLETLSLLKAQ